MILCCDTGTDFAVFALAGENGELLAELTLHHGRDLSRRFFGALDSLLVSGGISLEQVDAFAAGVGPGSFTGVRVAVATLKTLAQVAGKPLVGIGTLDIYAGALAGSVPDNACIVAVLPSRKGEVYAAAYDSAGRPLQPPMVAAHEQFKQLLSSLGEKHQVALCGAVSALPGPLPVSIGMEISSPLAAPFARLANRALRANPHADPAGVAPLYVAPPAISQHKIR